MTEQEGTSSPMYLIDMEYVPEIYGFRQTYVCEAGVDDLISQMLDDEEKRANEGDE